MAYDTAIIFGITVSGFVLAYLGANIKGKHFALQTLFIFMSLITLITSAGLMREIATIESLTANTINTLESHIFYMTIGFYIAIAYYIIFYVWEVFSKAWGNKKHSGGLANG